jgi:integrase
MAQIKKYTLENGESRYQFQIYAGIDPQTGKKKKTRRRGFKTRKEANLALSRLTLELENQSDLTIDKNILFVDVYHEWYSQYQNTVRESTLVRTDGLFQNHILPEFGNKRINTITINQVQKAVNKWFGQVLRNYRRWYHYTSQVFEFALKRDYVERNVARLITMPKRAEKPGEEHYNFWTKEELRLFFSKINATKDLEKYTLFRTLALTGIRRGECLALTWNDINFENSTLEINKTLTQGLKGKQIIQAPKTKASRRTIDLDPETVVFLKKYRIYQQKDFLLRGFNTVKKDQLVFPNTLNGYKSLNTPSKWLHSIIDDMDIKPITIHGFRHTHCSALFSAGASIKEVQQRLGHTDIKTTMDIYTHVTHEQNKEAVKKLVNYLDF